MPPREVWWFLIAKIPDLFTRESEDDKWAELSQMVKDWKDRQHVEGT